MSIQLTEEEANLVRQWFNAVQDINPAYLKEPDFKLAAKVYEACNARLPQSITQHLVVAEQRKYQPHRSWYKDGRKGCGRKIKSDHPMVDKCGFQYMPHEEPCMCKECGGTFDLAE